MSVHHYASLSPLSLFPWPHFFSTVLCSLGPHCNSLSWSTSFGLHVFPWSARHKAFPSNLESFAPFELYCAALRTTSLISLPNPPFTLYASTVGCWDFLEQVRKSGQLVILPNFIIAFNASWKIYFYFADTKLDVHGWIPIHFPIVLLSLNTHSLIPLTLTYF